MKLTNWTRKEEKGEIYKIQQVLKEYRKTVNGAKNILKRRSLMDIKLHTPKKIVLNVLVNQYFERLKGCNSAPLMDVIRVNPYFADLLEPQEDG